jgi:hypothetical protein
MNLATHYHDDPSWTIKDCFETAAGEMDGDLCGLWAIVARGRYGFRLKDNELREFVFTYILTLLTQDGVPIVGAGEGRVVGTRIWEQTSRYGTEPVETAEAITEEWIRQGEIDPPSYDGVAFTLPDYLESEDNIWPEPDPNLTLGP